MRVSKPTDFQTLCADLIALAQQAGPGARLPANQPLRASLGVSLATLKTALDQLEAQGIIERQRGRGTFVSSRLERRNIALISSPSFFEAADTSPFWPMLVEEVRRCADRLDEDCSLHFSGESPETGTFLQDYLADEIRTGRIHGVLAMGLDRPTAEWIVAQKVPLVAFAGPAAQMVVLDYERLVEQAVEQLASKGCRRIALWSPVSPHRPVPLSDEPSGRLQAFTRALSGLDLPYFPELVRENLDLSESVQTPAAPTHQEQGRRSVSAVFAEPRETWPDGIVSTDDLQTQGALLQLRERGLQAGRDVQIASHANRGSAILQKWKDDLTILEFDLTEIVQALFELLEALLRGAPPDPLVRFISPHLLLTRA